MSLFGFKKNSGHTTVQEQGYGGITSSTYHDTKSYVAKTEKVVAYGNFPAMIGTEYGSPRKDTHRISTFDQEHEKNGPFSLESRDVMARGNTKNSPWKNGGTNNSPPYYTTNEYGKYDDFNSNTNSSDDENDDLVCEDGVCANNKKGSRPADHRRDENYYENEKNKTNGYTPPTYSVPISTQPKKETRSEPYNSGYNDKDKATDHRSRSTTFATPAKNGTNYETPNNKSISTSPPERNAWPKNNSKKQETIDSAEARRRYGMESIRNGNYEVGNYNTYGTIDCREAAERYGGVLLPN